MSEDIRRAFDRKEITSVSGSTFIIYEPAWWQFWRWLYFWLFATVSCRCSVTWEGRRVYLRGVGKKIVTESATKESV